MKGSVPRCRSRWRHLAGLSVPTDPTGVNALAGGISLVGVTASTALAGPPFSLRYSGITGSSLGTSKRHQVFSASPMNLEVPGMVSFHPASLRGCSVSLIVQLAGFVERGRKKGGEKVLAASILHCSLVELGRLAEFHLPLALRSGPARSNLQILRARCPEGQRSIGHSHASGVGGSGESAAKLWVWWGSHT